MGADGGLSVCLGVAVAGGLGGTMNCGVEGVEGVEGAEGAEGVVGVGIDGEVLLAASKAIG